MKTNGLLVVAMALAGLAIPNQGAAAGTLRVLRDIAFPQKLRFGGDIAWDGHYLNVPGLVAVGDGSFGTGFLQIDPLEGLFASEFGLGGLPIRSAITFDGTDYWTTIATHFIDLAGVHILFPRHRKVEWFGGNEPRVDCV